MSKSDEIIKLGQDLVDNPSKGLKVLGAILIAGGTLYGGKKAIDAAYDHFKEKRKRKTEAVRTTEAGKREEKKTIEEGKREKAKTAEAEKRAKISKDSHNKGEGKDKELPKELAQSVSDKTVEVRVPRITLVPNLIRNNENSIIYGEAGIGKTYLGVQLAADLALGGGSTVFPDETFSVEPHMVVYYNYEQDCERIEENFMSLPFSIKNLIMIDQDTCEEKLSSVDLLLNDIELRVNSYPKGAQIVVFIDNLNRVIDNASAKTPVNQFIIRLEEQCRLARQSGRVLSNIILAHTNKQGEMQGTTILLEKPKTVIGFEEIDYEHRRIFIKKTNNKFPKVPYILHWAKYPNFGNSCLVFERIENETSTKGASQQPTEPTTKEKVIELAKKGLKPADIAQQLGISLQLVNYHLPEEYKHRGKGKKS